jgi:hypothetical protein
MALAVVGQTLLFGRWPGQGIISVAKLLARGYGRAVRLARVALGCCGHLNCQPGNQQRAEMASGTIA